jgi:hypothetical protein
MIHIDLRMTSYMKYPVNQLFVCTVHIQWIEAQPLIPRMWARTASNADDTPYTSKIASMCELFQRCEWHSNLHSSRALDSSSVSSQEIEPGRSTKMTTQPLCGRNVTTRFHHTKNTTWQSPLGTLFLIYIPKINDSRALTRYTTQLLSKSISLKPLNTSAVCFQR